MDLSDLISSLSGGPSVSFDDELRRYTRVASLDSDSLVLSVTASSSVCTDPDCDKKEGAIILVPGRQYIDLRIAASRMPDSVVEDYVTRLRNTVVLIVISEHDGEYVSIPLPLDDVRDLVNRLSQAVSHVDALNRKDPAS